MAYKLADIANSTNTLTPKPSSVMSKNVIVSRTDTAGKVAFNMKGHQKVLFFSVGGFSSDAGTTAVVNVGTTLLGTNYSTFDVKANSTTVKANLRAGTADVEQPQPDYQIFASYAETGAASTAGGPYVVTAYYQD